MKIYFLVLLFTISGSLFAQDKFVCISIDDLPLVRYGVKELGHEKTITDGLI